MRIKAQFENEVRPGGASRLGGFTILELTAVIAIIVVLVSLFCAALEHTKAKALRISCLDNMKQLNLAWSLYADDNDSYLALNKTAPAPNKPGIVARRLSTNSWAVGNPV